MLLLKLMSPEIVNIRDVREIDGVESGIYAEDTWQPFSTLKINGGLRFSHFLASRNTYHNFEPRISVAWRFLNDLAVKGSYTTMNQYIHMVSGTGINLPTDLWVPTTDRVKPQHSRQVAIGAVKDFREPEFSVSLEGYYKTMNNVISYKEGASFLELDEAESGMSLNWEENVTSGRAWSYGAEVLLQKKQGKFTGWIGYTLSWTYMKFDSLNFGRKYFARYDRRHDISVVGTYRFNDRITLSGNWVYGTGNAVTLPFAEYNVHYHDYSGAYYRPGSNLSWHSGRKVNDYSEKNNFRMSPYHRLDIGVQFHKPRKWGERIWEFSVYNIYSRKNPFYYYNSNVYDDKTQTTTGKLKQISLFPIIPSFTYSFRF